MRNYGFLTTHRGLSSHSWSLLLRSIPASEISLPFSIFPTSFVHFFSLFYTYPNSPFSFFLFPFFSPFLVFMLSHFSKTMSSRVPRLVDSRVLISNPHSDILSPTDRCIILYLAIFAVAGFRVGRFQIFHIPYYVTYILYPNDLRSTFQPLDCPGS